MSANVTPPDYKTQVPHKWDATKIPSLQDKIAIVTGANSGIGYEAALELTRKGANVILACRSEVRGKEAEQKIRDALAATPGAGSAQFVQLDVGSLKSVQQFSDNFKATHDRLDMLINNAGMMATSYALTADGYESQFAVNHLGHFALTAQLFDLLKKGPTSRIVNLGSLLHRDAHEVNEHEVTTPTDKYDTLATYGAAKLCAILFTKELARRIKAAGVEGVTAAACHPGITATSIISSATGGFWENFRLNFVNSLPVYQSASKGALPTLYAATAPNVQGGDYFGPRGFGQLWGRPALEQPSKLSESESAAKKLWALSEKLANLSFDLRS